ncbi:MAG: hypothetical protein H0T85_11390 [Geodermatophilaceae bacterium]|nr:hypothetical protein [Geodermatophilaceae bacterium]
MVDLLREWLPRQRWFGSKGREITALETVSRPLVPSASATPLVDLHLVHVDYADGGAETYVVPLSRREVAEDAAAAALVGTTDEGARHVYDAMRDRPATTAWLDLFAAGHVEGGLGFHTEPGAALPERTHGDLISTEQSNSSLIFGESAILKLFRRLEPGRNPDVEIHDALHERANEHVAPLLGFVSLDLPDGRGGSEESTLAMLQTFLPAASDGWSLATASVRDLYAEGDLHPDEVGGDFASESHRLGRATASVHADLAAVLPTAELDRAQLEAAVQGMTSRLAAALDVVPELEPYAEGLRARFAGLLTLSAPVPIQRVHGDYHLGQVLRTYQGWTILDFEGEPAKPLASRRGLDSPLRDIAGMLRSFDYAARRLLVESPPDRQLEYRANEWAVRNRTAFCDGYAAAGGVPPQDQPELLAAFEADKAVYEAVYEARNRPSWLPIPLSSLARIAQGVT